MLDEPAPPVMAVSQQIASTETEEIKKKEIAKSVVAPKIQTFENTPM